MMQGLNYIRRWDYDTSDTRLSEKNRPIGRWGRMYRDYMHVCSFCQTIAYNLPAAVFLWISPQM